MLRPEGACIALQEDAGNDAAGSAKNRARCNGTQRGAGSAHGFRQSGTSEKSSSNKDEGQCGCLSVS